MLTRSPARSLTRRGLLGVAAAGLLGVSGCRVQLQEDAPAIPLLPRRVPVPGETMLLALLSDTRHLAVAAAAVPGAPAGLVQAHQAQADTVQEALLHGGYPADRLPATPSSARPVATPEALAAAEVAYPSRTAVLSAGPAALRPALLALAAQRLATAAQLGRPLPSSDHAGSDTPVKLDPLIAATARARYLLQIVAAQSEGEQRARAEKSLEVATQQLQDFVGLQPKAADNLPLGYPLPSPVGDAPKAAKLATIAVSELVDAYGGVAQSMAALGEDVTADAFGYLPPLYAACVLEAARWGAPLSAFPGLQ